MMKHRFGPYPPDTLYRILTRFLFIAYVITLFLIINHIWLLIPIALGTFIIRWFLARIYDETLCGGLLPLLLYGGGAMLYALAGASSLHVIPICIIFLIEALSGALIQRSHSRWVFILNAAIYAIGIMLIWNVEQHISDFAVEPLLFYSGLILLAIDRTLNYLEHSYLVKRGATGARQGWLPRLRKKLKSGWWMNSR